jgi:hypothetical protein
VDLAAVDPVVVPVAIRVVVPAADLVVVDLVVVRVAIRVVDPVASQVVVPVASQAVVPAAPRVVVPVGPRATGTQRTREKARRKTQIFWQPSRLAPPATLQRRTSTTPLLFLMRMEGRCSFPSAPRQAT